MPCSAESTWPTITVAPNGSPAYALPVHQPTLRTSLGTWRTPSTVSAGTTVAAAPPGRVTRCGAKRTRWLRAGFASRGGGRGSGGSRRRLGQLAGRLERRRDRGRHRRCAAAEGQRDDERRRAQPVHVV